MGYKTFTCPISKNCGGCEWLAVPYPLQLKRKQAAMEELFADVIREDGAQLLPICGMDNPQNFRSKAATPFAPTKGGRLRSGFYAAGTHRIVSCEKCLVEDMRARPILNDVAELAWKLGIKAYQEDRGCGMLRHAIVRCGYASNDILLTLVTNGQQLPREQEFVRRLVALHPEISSIVQNINQKRTNALLGHKNKVLFGSGVMHDKLLGCTFEIGPTSFYQTNPQQTEVLYQLAIDAARSSSGDSTAQILDAYCGTGTIGICLAAQWKEAQVLGVDKVGAAITSARKNAQLNGLEKRCSFIGSDATEYMKVSGQHFNIVIMDPPRAGSTPRFLDGVVHTGAQNVVYISCNPVTQVRDIAHLRSRGYRVIRITPVDMFAHTKHVESLVLLARS